MTLLQSDPSDATILATRALQALNEGALAQALKCLDSLQRSPVDPAMALHLAGLASLRASEIGKAVNAFENAHRLSPTINEPVEVLAILYSKLGRLTDSLYFAKLSVAAQDRFPIAGLVPDWLGTFEQSFFAMSDRPLLAEAERAIAIGKFDDAIRCYRQASEVDPKAVETWRGLALGYRLAGQPFEALTALRQIEAIAPPTADDYSTLGLTLEGLGRWDDAKACHDQAVSMDPRNERIAWAALRCRLNEPAQAVEVTALTTRWAQDFTPPPIVDHPPSISPGISSGRPIRLGVYTASWLDDAALELIVPLLMALPRNRVSVHVYTDGYADTRLARRLRGHAESWESLIDVDDETAAFTLGNEELDAIIDLDGPSRRHHRPLLFMYRPHQNAFSFLDTVDVAKATGFAGVISDSMTGVSIENVIGIPGIAANLPTSLSLLTERVDQRAVPLAQPMFGTQAPLGRITPTTVTLWAQVLRSVPGSRLALNPARLGGENGIGDILARFERLGLRDQISVESETQTALSYLSRVDLLLDPPGCPHYESSIVALAAGVPVLTTPGNTPGSNVLAGWLQMLGMTELVASDEKAYVECARAAVAQEIGPIIRQKLGGAISREAAFGAAHRAKLLEAALRARLA